MVGGNGPRVDNQALRARVDNEALQVCNSNMDGRLFSFTLAAISAYIQTSFLVVAVHLHVTLLQFEV